MDHFNKSNTSQYRNLCSYFFIYCFHLLGREDMWCPTEWNWFLLLPNIASHLSSLPQKERWKVCFEVDIGFVEILNDCWRRRVENLSLSYFTRYPACCQSPTTWRDLCNVYATGFCECCSGGGRSHFWEFSELACFRHGRRKKYPWTWTAKTDKNAAVKFTSRAH